MTIYQVDPSRCSACGVCVEACPERAIQLKDKKARINPELCQGCGFCQPACKHNAIHAAEMQPQPVVPSVPPVAHPVPPTFGRPRQRRLRRQRWRTTVPGMLRVPD